MMITAARQLALRYGEMTLPVTLLAGSGDRIVSPRTHSTQLQESLPRSALQVVSGAGHMVHHSAPEQMVAAIAAAMRESASAAAPPVSADWMPDHSNPL